MFQFKAEQNDGNHVIVISANSVGRHGAGAAFFAHKHWGAEYGVGRGMTGQTYCIPTKDGNIKTLPLAKIKVAVQDFLLYAKANPDKTFLITAIGCGYAGYTPEQIAPLFQGCSANCVLPNEFDGLI